MFKTKKNAFTLAEILLTLVVIGIVAGLVLPVLLKDMQSKSRMSLLKSTLVGIDDIVHKEMAEKRTEDVTALSIYNNPDKFFERFNNAVAGAAFAGSYRNYNGTAAAVTIPTPTDSTLLKNGVGIGVYNNKLYGKDSTAIIIDITGENQPNTVGIDYFIAEMTWNEDLDNGFHTGDIHGYINGGSEGNETLAGLRSSCIGGSGSACFRLAELKGYEHNYLEE